MIWEELYSYKRYGKENSTSTDSNEYRSPFQKDYDRLIFSSPFRRLQNKTQVFPLPGRVFVHNRLTHSLEVSCVGRSLGNIVGQKISKEVKNKSDQFYRFYNQELGTVVAAACLAHDIGNPPFGHSGEKAISTYFTQLEPELKKYIQDHTTAQQWNDLLYFEGNANGLRVMTKPLDGNIQGGFRLTYTTLISMVKYPCISSEGNVKSSLFQKKYGYFQSENSVYENLKNEFKIPKISGFENSYVRHPFVYLVEAADDICYQIIDWEDAHRLKILSTEYTKDVLLEFFNDDPIQKDKLNSIYQTHHDANNFVALLRALIINKLTDQVAQIFWENRNQILEGNYSLSLTDHLPHHLKTNFDFVKKISYDEIYCHKNVIEIEIAGYKIISGLLEEFIPAILGKKPFLSDKIIQLIPNQFINQHDDSVYSKILSVLDFVSGMTDDYALELYRKFKGIQI